MYAQDGPILRMPTIPRLCLRAYLLAPHGWIHDVAMKVTILVTKVIPTHAIYALILSPSEPGCFVSWMFIIPAFCPTHSLVSFAIFVIFIIIIYITIIYI